MNSIPATRPQGGLLLGLAAAAIATLAACGGGGGSSTPLRVKSTIFGFDPYTGNFGASGEQGEAPIIPQNMCVVFDFNVNLRESSVSGASITVQEVDTSVIPPAPGPLAAASFQVSGRRLIICPLVTYSDTNVSYGFNSDKTYQVLFQVAPATSVVTSVEGKTISVADRGPYLFRTSATIFDQIPGAPAPTMRLLDHATGAELSTVATPFKPVPDVELTFNEPVLPPTVVDAGGVGTSPSIRIELDSDGDLDTDGDRSTLPGTYTLTETGTSAVVLWTSALSEIPTDLPNGCVYAITVEGTVEDLAGNSKISETHDAGAKDVFSFVTIPGSANTAASPVIEEFDDQTNVDLTVTSAKWGTVFPGFLTAGVGGGTGVDGVFDPSLASFQTTPPTDVTVDVLTSTVTMSTEVIASPGTPRVYQFTGFVVPLGWTVIATGPFALEVECSGNVQIDGTIDVSGAAGAVYVGGQVAHGDAGAAALGGGGGATGGATTDVGGTDTFFPGKVGATTTYPQLAFTAPGVGISNQGVSGRNTAITSFTLTDSFFASGLNALTSTNLWIQPNVAADDFRFERWHPDFRVTGIAAGVVTIQSNATSVDYRGPFDQETTNPYLEDDGNGGLRAPILAEQYDSYVIGELPGATASSLFDLDLDGLADDFTFFHGGAGSDAQSVQQTFITLGRSGGGGGGGNVEAGANGENDPTVDNGPGATGGTGTSGGAGGAAAPASTFLAKVDADTFTVATNLFDNGLGAPDTRLVGHLINPNTTQGNTFAIKTVDSLNQVTIEVITTSSGATIDLNNTTLVVGHTVRVTPPYIVGGTGGGGAGVHCGGSNKISNGHMGHPGLDDTRNQNGAATTVGFYDDDGGILPPNQVQDGKEDASESIFALPKWIAGAGGASGGGSFRLLTAGNVALASTGQILAEGGEGGRSDLVGVSSASGGGGGSGGTIFIGAGGLISVVNGGQISCAGGAGGAKGFGLAGGDGAGGRIRLENAAGNLTVNAFTGATTPPVTAENLGIFAGGGSSLGESLFMPSGVLQPLYQKLTITLNVIEDGVQLNDVTYIVNRDGTIDPTSTFSVPPFTFTLSYTTADQQTGLADLTAATPFTDPTADPLSGHDGQSFVRFKVLLADAASDVVIGAKHYRDIRINAVQIDLNGGKP